MIKSTAGQAFLEFITTLSIFGLLTIGASSLLVRQWLRTQCIHDTFQYARAHLEGRRPSPSRPLFAHDFARFWIEESEQAWSGTGKCGWGRISVRETVRIPKWDRSP